MDKVFEIAVPSDGKGFIGRACDAADCGQYFKIRIPDHKEALFCPYCGVSYSKNSLLTREQSEYIHEAAIEEIRVYAMEEIQKAFKDAFRGSRNVSVKHGKIPPKRPVAARYKEREVDTELHCPECSTQFQVYGIFGYCPGCKCENLQIYDANWVMIRQRLASSPDPKRELRHAYGDLVSTFEFFCKRRGERITSERGKFQMLDEAQKFFSKHAHLDILGGLSGPELLALRRVFQKRHVYVHGGGIIDDRYVRIVPEDSHLLGTEAALSEQELSEGATAMRLAISKLVRHLERPGK